VHAEPSNTDISESEGPAQGEADDPNAPHVVSLGSVPVEEQVACLFCSRAIDDPLHVEGERLREAERQNIKAAEIAATFVCDDCIASGADAAAATHPKAEGFWLDSEARKVCPNCRQAAIEGGRWAHTFKAGHLRAKKCSDCGFRLDHATHVPPDEEPANQGEVLTGDGSGAALPEASGDPAYDFDASEKPPAVIASARAIDEAPQPGENTQELDADEDLGGEAGA
jgi:predicted RNA-binding Zn-ribbon protein involved in translation (DUF1610 family)